MVGPLLPRSPRRCSMASSWSGGGCVRVVAAEVTIGLGASAPGCAALGVALDLDVGPANGCPLLCL